MTQLANVGAAIGALMLSLNSTPVVATLSLQPPLSWQLTPVMAPTEVLGLNLKVYAIDAPRQAVERWRDTTMQHCRIAVLPVSPSGIWPQTDAAYSDDWHCIDTHKIYSLLQRDEVYLWVTGERIAVSTSGYPTPLITYLREQGGELLTQSSTEVERVSVWSSKRSLYALERGLAAFKHGRGAVLLSQQVSADGFVQSWQLHAERIHITAQRSDDGDVLLTTVEGTNL